MKLKGFIGFGLSMVMMLSSLSVVSAEHVGDMIPDRTSPTKIQYQVEGGHIDLDESTGIITHCSSAIFSYFKSINIPSKIYGVSVTSIGQMAFSSCSTLQSVTIPDSVTSIGDFAFCKCSSLTSITIPDSVTNIGDYVFSECSSLTSITIPNSVTNIGDYVFRDCSGLKDITIPDCVTSIGNYTFSHCSGLTSISIPDNVTSIGEGAFSGCSGLTSITIPANVTSIEKRAFFDCSGLTSITIPNNVTSIESKAFSYCSNLTSIIIPSSVISINEDAFNSCDKNELIFYVEKDSYADTWAQENGWKVSYEITTATETTTITEFYSETTTETTTDEVTEVTTSDTINSDIKVTIGSGNVIIGDKTYNIDAAPYIQLSSNSTMVPLRFVSIAILGDDIENADNSNIIGWNSDTKTATITVDNKSIAFTAGSDKIVVDGTATTMENGVNAEIKDGRMYIPFRALGNALGVQVDWLADTKTAVYKA